MNLVEDGFAGWVDELCGGGPRVAFRPQKLEVTLDGTSQFSPDPCGFGTVVGEYAVEQDDVGSEWRDLGGLGVVEAFSGIDEKAEHQRGCGSHHANASPYDFFRFGTNVLCRQKALENIPKRAPAKAHAKTRRLTLTGIIAINL